jgi:hypothetical protein
VTFVRPALWLAGPWRRSRGHLGGWGATQRHPDLRAACMRSLGMVALADPGSQYSDPPILLELRFEPPGLFECPCIGWRAVKSLTP